MKTKKLPFLGLKSILIDKENNCLIATYEEEKPVLETGKWYVGNLSPVLYLGDGVGYSVTCDNVTVTDANYWKPANMAEVKRLLIKEAEKKGFKEGVKYLSPDRKFIRTVKGAIDLDLDFDFVCLTDQDGYFIFDGKTGKWAEIEEKKPLYVNAYGTAFFEGDKAWYVIISTSVIELFEDDIHFENDACKSTYDATEIMTKKECYQYLADHCEE